MMYWTSFGTVLETIYLQTYMGEQNPTPGTNEYSTALTSEQQHVTEGLVSYGYWTIF